MNLVLIEIGLHFGKIGFFGFGRSSFKQRLIVGDQLLAFFSNRFSQIISG